MGGRVVQKYVETPLLLPRRSQQRKPLKKSRHINRDVHRRSNLRLCQSCIHGGEGNGVESSSRARPWERKGNTSANKIDSGKVVDIQKEVCSDGLDTAETEPKLSDGKTASPPGRTIHELRGDTKDSKIDSSTLAGARKFDIRAWVLVSGWDPLEAFVFDQCYLRVCPQDFSLSESKFTDPQVHLTNLSARRPVDRTSKVCKQWQGHRRRGQRREHTRPLSASTAAGRVVDCNKKGVQEGGGTFAEQPDDLPARESTDNEASVNCGEERDAGDCCVGDTFVANQAELIRRLGEMDQVRGVRWPTRRTEEDVWARGERLWKNKVWPSIEGVVRSTLLAAKPNITPRTSSFQLFGFDLLLDHQFHPCEWTAIPGEDHVMYQIQIWIKNRLVFCCEVPFP